MARDDTFVSFLMFGGFHPATLPYKECARLTSISDAVAGDRLRFIGRSGLILLFLAFPPSPDLTSHRFEVEHYQIFLDLTHPGGQIMGQCRLLIQPIVRASRAELDLAEMTVDAVSVDGLDASWKSSGEKLSIALPRPAAEGRPRWITIRYHGTPREGLSSRRNKEGEPAWFGDNWPRRLHHWVPSDDEPSRKATVDLSILAPSRLEVVAPGRLVERAMRGDGNTLTRWREESPIPVYTIVFGAAEFAVTRQLSSSGLEVSSYLYQKERPHAGAAYERAPRMVDIFEKTIGPFPYEKLALVEAVTRFRGMENAGAIFFDEKQVDGSTRMESTVAHEIAHQWFGDALTAADWHDLWLSEGFATYFSSLFYEEADGPEVFRRQMEQQKERYLAATAIHSRPIFDPEVTDPMRLLGANSYQKGSWVLHMLRHVVGDEHFFAGIHDYYAQYRNGTVSTREFQHVMERRSGMPLDWFFDEWIYRPGFPRYRCTWKWNQTKGTLSIEVAQLQKRLFIMPADLLVRTAGKVIRTRITLRDRVSRITIPMPSAPQRVTLDPDGWILTTTH
jgi:aminopeptidase N